MTEFGGQDAFFLISDDQSVATSSNGFYLKASSSATVIPNVDRSLRFASGVPIAQDNESDLTVLTQYCWKREQKTWTEYDDSSYMTGLKQVSYFSDK